MKLSSELRARAVHKCQKVIFHTQQKQRVNKLPSINCERHWLHYLSLTAVRRLSYFRFDRWNFHFFKRKLKLNCLLLFQRLWSQKNNELFKPVLFIRSYELQSLVKRTKNRYAVMSGPGLAIADELLINACPFIKIVVITARPSGIVVTHRHYIMARWSLRCWSNMVKGLNLNLEIKL